MAKKFFLHPKYFIYDFIRVTLALPGFIFWRPKYLYENKAAKKHIKDGALIISNHLGFMDPVYIMYALPYRRVYFVALKIFFNTKFKNFMFRHFLCIPIDRENFSMSTFREITGHLKNGELVSIFPEGHINTEEEKGLQTFKSGMVLMALQSGKPIVPMFVEKKKGILNRLVIVTGEPISFDAKNVNMQRIEDITQSLYNKEQLLREIATRKRG